MGAFHLHLLCQIQGVTQVDSEFEKMAELIARQSGIFAGHPVRRWDFLYAFCLSLFDNSALTSLISGLTVFRLKSNRQPAA
jgi:hypothetical protein